MRLSVLLTHLRNSNVPGTNGVVHGNLRDFRKRRDRRVVHPPGHRHQFENLETSLVFPRFNAVRTLTYDGARALLLRRDCHRFADADVRAEQPVRRQQPMSFCEAHAANLATSSVSTLQHLQSH